MDLYSEIAKSTAHRPVRDKISGYVLENPDAFPALFKIALNPDDPFHYKACWNLELVLEKRIEWLQPELEKFCKVLPEFRHDGALRSIAKCCQFIAEAHYSGKEKRLVATRTQLTQIAESCLDWLIGDCKIATRVYAMRALFLIGQDENWIYPELRAILTKDFPGYSAGGKSAAKELLRRLP